MQTLTTTNTTNKRINSSVKRAVFTPQRERTIEWIGGVNYDNLRSTLKSIKEFVKADPKGEIQLMVNSYGGATAIGMNFYDSVKSLHKPNLTTIGSGEVDSSGIIVFLAGQKRFLTKNTTMLLHLGGRTFEKDKRFSSLDLENILKEMHLKDYQYACVIADASGGRVTPERVLELMAKETILTAEEAVNMGIAHRVLG